MYLTNGRKIKAIKIYISLMQYENVYPKGQADPDNRCPDKWSSTVLHTDFGTYQPPLQRVLRALCPRYSFRGSRLNKAVGLGQVFGISGDVRLLPRTPSRRGHGRLYHICPIFINTTHRCTQRTLCSLSCYGIVSKIIRAVKHKSYIRSLYGGVSRVAYSV